MEISVQAEQAGIVEAIYCATGRPAAAGDALLALRPAGAGHVNLSHRGTARGLSGRRHDSVASDRDAADPPRRSQTITTCGSVASSPDGAAPTCGRTRAAAAGRICRCTAYRSRSRTTSIWQACRRPRPALRSPTCRPASARRRAAAARCRRDSARQDQPRPVRDRPGRHALALRRLPQQLRSGPHQRRIVERLGGCGRTGARELCAGHRHGRLRSHSGGIQQPGRIQADAGHCSARAVSCRPAARSMRCRSSR